MPSFTIQYGAARLEGELVRSPGSTMNPHTPERRTQTRKPARVPVKLRQPDGSELQGLTRDLSSTGVFLYSDGALTAGSKLELVVMLPPSLGIGPGGWTLCQASVVRV